MKLTNSEIGISKALFHNVTHKGLIKKHQNYHHCYQTRLINMIILQEKKYYLPVKVKSYNKLNLHILLLEKNLKNM